MDYLNQWEESMGGRDSAAADMRIDHAREALRAVLADLTNPTRPTQKDNLSSIDRDGDIHMADGTGVNGMNADIVTIPISAEDELSEIPAEMREIVAKEITSFRDRSNRRDIERLKREEEIAEQERNRENGVGRGNRLNSPPPSAPSGPAGSTNGIPVGPRTLNAPAGPKGFAKDYQKSVTFVNGTGVSAASAFEDEDTDASDEELERRRKAKKDADIEKIFLDQERRWLGRERSRTAAIEREKKRDDEQEDRIRKDKETMAQRLKEWDDDVEAKRGLEEYYVDRSLWLRNRASFRQRESAMDEVDRSAEQREAARQRNINQQRAGAMADDFLSRQADELERNPFTAPSQPPPREPATRFKLSLGAAAAQHARDREVAAKRTVADVEGLLEDEEDVDATITRKLIPIKIDPSAANNAMANMSDEERQAAARSLAQEIPTDRAGLWAWDVQWDFVGEDVIDEKLRPFVEKRVVEALGVLEGTIVDVVVTGLREKSKPQALVEELEGVSSFFPVPVYFSTSIILSPFSSSPFHTIGHQRLLPLLLLLLLLTIIVTTGTGRRSRSPRPQTLAHAHLLLGERETGDRCLEFLSLHTLTRPLHIF